MLAAKLSSTADDDCKRSAASERHCFSSWLCRQVELASTPLASSRRKRQVFFWIYSSHSSRPVKPRAEAPKSSSERSRTPGVLESVSSGGIAPHLALRIDRGCAERCDAACARFPTGGPMRTAGFYSSSTAKTSVFVQHSFAYGDILAEICALKGVRSRYRDSVPFLGLLSRFPDSCEGCQCGPRGQGGSAGVSTLFQLGHSFPCFWRCIPLLLQIAYPVIFCQRTGKNARNIGSSEARAAAFHPEIGISLYFSLFFPAETGSPRTAWSASQSGLCGSASRSVRNSGISAA